MNGAFPGGLRWPGLPSNAIAKCQMMLENVAHSSSSSPSKDMLVSAGAPSRPLSASALRALLQSATRSGGDGKHSSANGEYELSGRQVMLRGLPAAAASATGVAGAGMSLSLPTIQLNNINVFPKKERPLSYSTHGEETYNAGDADEVRNEQFVSVGGRTAEHLDSDRTIRQEDDEAGVAATKRPRGEARTRRLSYVPPPPPLAEEIRRRRKSRLKS